MKKAPLSPLLCFLLSVLILPSFASADPLDMGDTFPEIPLPAPGSQKQRDYLGLINEQPFALKDERPAYLVWIGEPSNSGLSAPTGSLVFLLLQSFAEDIAQRCA